MQLEDITCLLNGGHVRRRALDTEPLDGEKKKYKKKTPPQHFTSESLKVQFSSLRFW